MFSKEGSFPVYSLAEAVDGCNYSNRTVWEGDIDQKLYIYNGVHLGKQFIGEATEVNLFINKKYDFIISSNCLEHIANPLKAVQSWISTLKSKGYLLLILPNKQSNFDHLRKDTSFSHLLDDYNHETTEDDISHFAEIMSSHDLNRDIAAGNKESFLERSKKNYENRCFHHHVFSKQVLCDIYLFFNLQILYCGEDWSNIYIIGQKHENIGNRNIISSDK